MVPGLAMVIEYTAVLIAVTVVAIRRKRSRQVRDSVPVSGSSGITTARTR
jgi:hypothetical protein